MSWKDNLRSASFRDVPFKVMDTTTSVGRRNVLHEYPFADIPYVEDLGRSASIYTVVGYVIQNIENDMDYFAERDALMAALEAEGPGTLVHPFHGDLQVALQGNASIDEKFSEGGIARFSMTFMQAGVSISPEDIADFEGELDAQADAALDESGEAFEEAYDESGPDFITGVKGAVADAQAGLDMVTSTISAVQSTIVGTISKALTTVASIRASIDKITKFPATLKAAIRNTLGTYSSLIPGASGRSLVSASKEVSRLGQTSTSGEASIYGGTIDDEIPQTTAARVQQADNRKAIVDFFKVGSLIESMRAAGAVDYESYEEAQDTLIGLYDDIDRVLEEIGSEIPFNDRTFDALRGMKPFLVDVLTSKGLGLSRVAAYTVPPTVTPTLVIAHTLYKDVAREQEIIDRNPVDIVHPGFPAAGEELEVFNE